MKGSADDSGVVRSVVNVIERRSDSESGSGGKGALDQSKTVGKGRIIEADMNGGRGGLIGGSGKSFEDVVDKGCVDGHGHGHEQSAYRRSSSLSGNVASGALARDIHRDTKRSKALPNAPNVPTGLSAPVVDQPLNDDDVEHGFVDHDIDDIAITPIPILTVILTPLISLFLIY